MRNPRSKVTPTRTEVIIMGGGVKQDVSQLELKPGELILGENYQEIDGAYHGYASLPGYEVFDGQALASSIDSVNLNDYGDDSRSVLLLESDSQDIIEDISVYGHTIANTNVINDTSNYKFLTSSFYFNGSSVLTVTPVDTTLDLKDEDFTIDLLIDPLDQVSTQEILSKGTYSYSIELINHRIVFKYSTDGVTWAGTLTSNQYISSSTRFHLTVSRKDDTVYLFFDGDKDDNSLSIGIDVIFTNTDDLTIGTSFIGRMDEIRISNILRWINDFDIPVLPYSQDYYYTYQIDDEDREIQRALIEEVPGSGSVLGIAMNSFGDIGAVRNDVGGTNSFIYRADPTGWSSPIPGVFYGRFEDGVDTDPSYPGFIAGETITGSISGATGVITDIATESGSWEDHPSYRNATGILVLKDVVGTFDPLDSLSNGVTAIATEVTGTLGEYALAPNGDYQFINARFDLLIDLQRQSVPFFVNGVNYPIYFDGTQIIPILDPQLPDSQGIFATHIADFKNRLWFVYPDGRLWYSGVGDPLNWDVATGGAGEIYMEDEITGLQVGQGDVLIVFCRNSTQIIKTISDARNPSVDQDYAFFNETFSQVTGSLPNTIEKIMGEVVFLDDHGLTSMSTSSEYGGFSSASISKNVQNLLLSKKNFIVTSAAHRGNNQYRLFFSDMTGLIFTFDMEKKVKGVTCLKYNTDLTCFVEGEDSTGNLQMFFGSSDGFVYKMDSGTSFNGEVINTRLSTSFYSYKSPTNWKRFRKITMEAQADKNFIFSGAPEYNYRSSDIPKSSQGEYISKGYGGVWGTDAWELFAYGSEEVQSPHLMLSGYGNNMSMTIATSDKYAQPHVVNSLITEFSLVGRVM